MDDTRSDGEAKRALLARRPRRVTASDVAERAGVSRSAVSRAFSEGAYLDEEKRQRILTSATELGYHPNVMAAAMTGVRSNLIAVVSGDMSREQDSAFLSHLVSELNAIGKWPVLFGGNEVEPEDSLLPILRYPLDALIVRGGSVFPTLVERCTKLNIPMILSGQVLELPGVDCVCSRNADGAAMATDLLLSKGRLRFGYIGGPSDWYSDRERLAGVRKRLKQNDLQPQSVIYADYTYEGGRNAAREMFSSTADINAIICANDAMALGALAYLRHETRLRVPADVSIIGFDDIAMSAWPDFDLTTVRNPIDKAVSEILRLLEKRLQQPDCAEEVVLTDLSLTLRGTH
ncbi:MAG: LacI family DNA-binding transcriptional regulator [Pseudomonadota bacterium]